MNTFIAEISGNAAILNEDESLHCAKVLRKKVGDKIQLIDGKGNFFDGELIFISGKKCEVKIISEQRSQPKRNYYLHLAIAPTKQVERLEWLIEKCVEIGIDEITFLQCHNSERTKLNLERLKKIAESAVKQSLQAFIPILNGITKFSEALNIQSENKLIAHCFDVNKSSLQKINFKEKSTLIFVGPEGDFTKEEITKAGENDFLSIDLGRNRLRTETAGLYVCQGISLLSQL